MTRRQIENSPLLYLSASLVTLTAFSGLILSSFPVSADNDTVIDEVDITVPSSCTISGGTTFNLSMDPNTYEEAGPSNITAYCNDSEGFAVYAKGTSTVDETNGDNAKLLGLTATNKIATGTATSGSTSNWAMKLVLPTGSPTYPATIVNGYNAYSAVPTGWTKVISRNSGTDIGTNAEGSSFSAYYAIFVSGTQVPDTYSGQVTYLLVHPSDADPFPPEPIECSAYEVCFSSNAYNAVGTMGNGSDIEYDYGLDEIEISLLPSNYSRKGYGFAGWNDKYDYTGTNYGPIEKLTIPMYETDFEDTGLSFYAIWIKSAGYLQDWQGCSSLPAGQVTALTDERDDETYAIAKLADGKCWMIENLRLDDSAILTSQNTNNPSLPLTILNLDGTTTTANRLSPSNNGGWEIHMYESDNTHDDWALSLLNTSNTTDRALSPTTTNYTKFYSYGNYYNWYSATAATDKNDEKRNNESTDGDICPTGWRLPIGGDASNISNSDFAGLDIALGGTGANSGPNSNPTGSTMASRYKTYPNNFVYSGKYINYIDWLGEYGEYWASTTGSRKSAAYLLNIQDDYVYPGTNSGNKGGGTSIRCLTE